MKISKHSHGAEGTYRESFFFVAKVLDLNAIIDKIKCLCYYMCHGLEKGRQPIEKLKNIMTNMKM